MATTDAGTLDAAAVAERVRDTIHDLDHIIAHSNTWSVSRDQARVARSRLCEVLGMAEGASTREVALVGANFALVPGASWGATQELLRELVLGHPDVFLDWHPYRDAEVLRVPWPYKLGAAFEAADAKCEDDPDGA